MVSEDLLRPIIIKILTVVNEKWITFSIYTQNTEAISLSTYIMLAVLDFILGILLVF